MPRYEVTVRRTLTEVHTVDAENRAMAEEMALEETPLEGSDRPWLDIQENAFVQRVREVEG